MSTITSPLPDEDFTFLRVWSEAHGTSAEAFLARQAHNLREHLQRPLQADVEGATGIIAPGINLSLDALVAATAKLPRVAIEAPTSKSVIGRTTEHQMVIGIYWGYIAMIEGLLRRMKSEIGRPVKVIATGGLAPLFEQHGHLFDAVEPDLTLRRLAILHARSI